MESSLPSSEDPQVAQRSFLYRTFKLVFSLSVVVCCLVIIVLSGLLLMRPSGHVKKVYRPGVWYERIPLHTSVPIKINLVHIDLKNNDVKAMITPYDSLDDEKRPSFRPRTTSEFLTEYKVQVAINGGYYMVDFGVEAEDSFFPWRMFPEFADNLYPQGTYILKELNYNSGFRANSIVCISAEGKLSMHFRSCPEGTVQGISAGEYVLGPLRRKSPPHDNRYAHSIIASNHEEEWIELIVIDGQQPFYSAGIDRFELVNFLKKRNVTTALRLDGGNSSTLVIEEPEGPHLLNVPHDHFIPFRERHVATHIGFSIADFHASSEEK